MSGSFSKLTFSGTMPSSAAGTCSPSPDGLYIAVSAAGGVFIYKRNGGAGTLAYIYLTTIAVSSTYCVWSHDGTCLAIGRSVSDWIRSYKRSGDTFTLVTSGRPFVGGAVRGMAFSDDDSILAVATAAVSQTAVAMLFNAASGAMGTQLTLPSMGSSIGEAVAFAGNDLISATRNSPFTNFWRWNGSAYTKLTSDVIASGNPWHVAVTEDDNYAIFPTNSSPYVAVFKKNGSVWDDVTNIVGGNIGNVPTGLEVFDKDRQVIEHAVATTSGNRIFFKKSGDTLTLATRSDVDNPLPFQSQYIKRNYDGSIIGIAGRASPGFQAYLWASTDVIGNAAPSTKPFKAAATAKLKIKVTTGNKKTQKFTAAGVAKISRSAEGVLVGPKFTTNALVNIDPSPVTDTNPWPIYCVYVLYESPFEAFASGSPDHPYAYGTPSFQRFTTDGMIKFPIQTDAVALETRRFTTDGYIEMPIEGTSTVHLPHFTAQADAVLHPLTLNVEAVTKPFTAAGVIHVPFAATIPLAIVNPFIAAGTVKVVLGATGALVTKPFQAHTDAENRYQVTGALVGPHFVTAGLIPVGPGEDVDAILVTPAFTTTASAQLRTRRRKVRTISVS